MARPDSLRTAGDESDLGRTSDAGGRDLQSSVSKLRSVRGSLAASDRPWRPRPVLVEPGISVPGTVVLRRSSRWRRNASGVAVAAAIVLGVAAWAAGYRTATWNVVRSVPTADPLADRIALAADRSEIVVPSVAIVIDDGPRAALATRAWSPVEALAPGAPLLDAGPVATEDDGPSPADTASDAIDTTPPADVGVAPARGDAMVPGGTTALATIAFAPRAPEPLPPLPIDQAVPAIETLLTLRPIGVWLVEAGPGWEQYSNGLRIETSYVVDGQPRRYRTFTERDGMGTEIYEQPVGILFHTTESHVFPLEAAYNDDLRALGQNVLGYVQRERLYNYLIDRFGRVYRIVSEETKANHAGNSIWQSGDRIYLNLNHAFLGVSFETRWAGGTALPITQAQLTAGQNLTAWLRQRWTIAPDMCVTHGLTSVNPRAHLVGHHVDWAQGFPFAAFGLPDLYRRAAPSVFLFGFGYDKHFLKVLGEPWSGIREAERALADEAARQGRSLDDLRRERRALYDRWLQEQARADDPSQRTAAPTTAGGL